MSQNSAAAAEITAELKSLPTQQLAVDGSSPAAIIRDSYSLTEKAVPAATTAIAAAKASGKASGNAAAPAAGVPNPGSAQDIAHQMVADRGWGDDQFNCLVALWNRESGWNAFAHNGGSGAYGIPQALPGTKMATAGPDWATNPATQITWGLGYISGRYGTPCGAWASSQSKGWY
ncbi:MAG: transglycosylase SLT domain-containing protein [Microbacteriaceae bacterium]|nr:transglycosylase SLT domain-containing protein [Microbacteriaceae bacterium]